MMGTAECCEWTERRLTAMGSPAVIIAGDAPPHAVDWALTEIERLEQCWSRFRPGSELSRLNRSAGQWFAAGPTLLLAIDRALHLAQLTDGLFDPTVHDRLVAAGYDRPFRHLDPHQDAPAPSPSPAPGVAGVERAQGRIRLPARVALDLGGVGKGLAADIVASGLVAMGSRSACVSLGGDIRVAGDPPPPGWWSIPVADPAAPGGRLGHVRLGDAAIVTSTTAHRRWTRGGRPMHHLIDPRTGLPAAQGVLAVVVTAAEAWLAEGLAKAALVAGPVGGRRLLDRTGVGGWIVSDTGICTASEWAPEMSADPTPGTP